MHYHDHHSKSVTFIGNNGFGLCSSLTSIQVEQGNTVYDSRNNCNAIIETATNTLLQGCQKTIIPKDVTSIGNYAFDQCDGLASVTIPKSVTFIGNSAFRCCQSLTSIQVEQGNPVYDARNNCNALIETATNTLMQGCTNTVIPQDIESIGNYAFSGCSGLTSVTLPNGVKTIGDYAFQSCMDLTAVIIPNSVTSIGQYAFNNCQFLTSLIIPNSVTSIGNSAFWGCWRLTSLAIPNNVTFIGEETFSGCTGLTSMTIPNNVTSIGIDAFYGCSGLTNITIPNSVTSIGQAAFAYSINLEKVIIKDLASWCKLNFDGILSNPLSYAHHLYGDEHTEITELVLPEGTTNIGDYTFYGCSGLTSLTIPEGVTNINHSAFSGCSGLTSVIIPHSVENIGHHAFFNCSGLTSLMIPESVTSIGDYAFIGCSSLASINVDERNTVYDSRNNSNAIIETASNTLLQGCNFTTIPSGVTSISYWAFRQCLGLSSIIIPNSVKEIGMVAFDGCSNLKDVYCHAENIPTASASIFDNVKLKESTLHVPTVSIELYQHTIPWSSFGKIVPLTPEEEALGINASTTTKSQIQQIYTPTGQAVNTLQPGVNIIRYSNGQVKKVQGR